MPQDSRDFVKGLPTGPGIYRMLDAAGTVLYVGKARSLRKRVQSYFRATGLSPKVHAMMQNVADVDVTVTRTEGEALLLENNLIKSLRPRYNILLRDDKSYPYIFVSEQEFPRLGFHRGARRAKGRYFGPYPSAHAVRESLSLLQKVFTVRQCEDSFFNNRSRPCLQYQIKRCSAPCVGLVTAARYQQDVHHALMFLEGRSASVIGEMIKSMEDASARQDYESAALYRDRIATLRRIQERQYVSTGGGEADIVAIATAQDTACIKVGYVRGGLNVGDKTFFIKIGATGRDADALGAFLSQYYLAQLHAGRPIPARIYVNRAAPERPLLERVLGQQARKKISISVANRGAPRRWAEMAKLNATDALRRELAGKASLHERFDALRAAFALDEIPERVECFDISHTRGEAPVASCVVFDQTGPVKSAYRRFNIEGVEPGDDYAALTQALTRRYRRVQEGEGVLPDVLLIDGGKGQLHVAEQVLSELQIDGVRIVGVAKGRERQPGKEQLFLSGEKAATILASDSPALHLIQQVRDEAHRFALTAHRGRRAKARVTSSLESIPGVGDRRRQALLRSFGGLREVARAGVEDIARVPGISPQLAQRIYDALHEPGN
jgi:excinuclease ABC subunit C